MYGKLSVQTLPKVEKGLIKVKTSTKLDARLDSRFELG